MSPLPISVDASHIDLSPRVFTSTAVAGSPALAAETTVCTVTCSGDLASTLGVVIVAFCALTVGTSGSAVTAKIRRTDTSGTTVVSTGAMTGGVAAGNLLSYTVLGFDSGGFTNGRVYVLTLTITAGAAVSTVSAAGLVAVVV